MTNRAYNQANRIGTGDVVKYFTEFNNMIQRNSGVHDNRFVQADSYNPPCPTMLNGETWFVMTMVGVDVINIDKSFIQMRVQITFRVEELLEIYHLM